MVLVALSMVAVIAMAALSIDVITIYLAREEAQRSADTAALAAARVISLSGITGDPSNTASSWQAICGGPSKPASQSASAVALQNMVGGATANNVTVTYGGSTATDCSTLVSTSPNAFSTNPTVTVQVQRTNLPNFFSRIWTRSGTNVSASATAEVFNSSYSGSITGTIVPVQPACVKPWVVPNHDPWSLGSSTGPFCDQSGQKACNPLVNTTDGAIGNPGISLNGGNTQGVIGEQFWLNADCHYAGATCRLRSPPQANFVPVGGSIHVKAAPNLHYLPGQVLSNAAAVPSCSSSSGSMYETNVAGCDQSTVYQCGVQSSVAASPNMLDLSENPAGSGDTTNGVQCLIHEGDPSAAQPDGQDSLSPFEKPSSYPFQILAGGSNPLVGLALSAGSPITSSPSIVSLPIYDDSGVTPGPATTPVTIVGFLQLFINAVDPYGNVDVTVLNVVGCSNGAGGNTYPVGASSIAGTSPVPIRLITPP